MPGHTLHHHDAECDEFVKELVQLRRNNVVRCSLVACQPTITTAVCLSVCLFRTAVNVQHCEENDAAAGFSQPASLLSFLSLFYQVTTRSLAQNKRSYTPNVQMQ